MDFHTTSPHKKLIVNADDYALTDGISRGILRAARQGVVTSTSVLAVGPSFERAAQWLSDTASIGVGVHCALVGEDPPLSPAFEIPTLVDRRGRFPRTLRGFAARAALGQVDPSDVARELTAQIQSVAAIGHPISHLDAHQHLQLIPLIGQTILALGRRFRVPAIRVPDVSPVNSLWLPISVLGSRLRRHATAHGMLVPHHSIGIDVAGRLDSTRLRATLEQLAVARGSVVELTVHPGERHDPQRFRYRWGYRWYEELAALTDPAIRRVVDRLGLELATYSTARDAATRQTRDLVSVRHDTPATLSLRSELLRGPHRS